MLAKTFKAKNMPEALRMVKSEFGPDALILSSRKERKKGFLGRFTKPYFEVTAFPDTSHHVTEQKTSGRKEDDNAMVEFQKSMLAPIARELKELRAKVATLSDREVDINKHPEIKPKHWMSDDNGLQETEKSGQISDFEVEELKKVLLGSYGKKATDIPVNRPDESLFAKRTSNAKELAALTADLRLNGVEESAISQLMTDVSTSDDAGEESLSLRDRLYRSILSNINCSGTTKLANGSPRLVTLIGPTGVGKTTTIAKLAALACKQGLKVGLITIDTYRVGAIAQMNSYADLLGVQLSVAKTPEELKAAIKLNKDKQLVFIDTAGGSPGDRKKIIELKSFLDVCPDIETHLCLAATTRDNDLFQTVARYSAVGVKKMIFTKLDESLSFGCIVNTHVRSRIPLSYFTTGQRVPEDIETARSQKVADLILREI